MTVEELLSEYLQPATLDDSVGDALAMAGRLGLQTLPVVDKEERLVATVKISELAAADKEKPLHECHLSAPLCISSEARMFEAIALVVHNQVDLLPVVDDQARYVGALDLHGLLRTLSRTVGIGDEGSVFEVDMPPRDYSLGRLVHTIEEHGAKVLSIFSDSPHSEGAHTRVIVKVSVTDTLRIRAVLEHYGYRVAAVEPQESSAEDIQQRVREFMHYLDV